MSKRWLIAGLSFIALVACAKGERMSTADLVKQVATEARPKLRVQVMIRASADEPTAADRALLRSIEDAIERKNVGRLVSSGAESGTMFVTVEVEKTADAIATLRTILEAAGVRDRSSFKVIQPE
jgi:AMMECR1 domain-containing protein